MLVRPARPDDAEAMSLVLTASIRELCGADHRDDPEAIARWVVNKTPEAVAAMLAAGRSSFYVAEREGAAAGVGCISGTAEIGLNYVHPDHRFTGVSKALLATMEEAIATSGADEAHLASTITAHRFYLAAGWCDAGAAQARIEGNCYPMRKSLRGR